MASIIKKKSKYSTYYVIAESARVDGKPRIVKQWYLGTIEKIIAMAEGSTDKEEPRQIDCVSEGAIAVLFKIAKELGIRKIIDQYCSKRQQGMSVGDYILIAALNRALAATSKAKSQNGSIPRPCISTCRFRRKSWNPRTSGIILTNWTKR